VSQEEMQRYEVSDAQIRVMLEAFAGPASPLLPARPKRTARRTLVLVVAGLVALGLAVPAALALLGKWESTKQFLSDRSQPADVKSMVRQLNGSTNQLWLQQHIRLLALEHVLTTQTPDGQAAVYALRFDHSDIGLAVVGRPLSCPPGKSVPGIGLAGTCFGTTPGMFFVLPTSKKVEGPANTILARPCSRGWALQRLGGTTKQVGKTYGYVIGRASAKVAAVDVLYHDGTTTKAVLGNGYFLAWIKPSAGWTNVTLIAKNAAGHTLAQLVSGGYGGTPYPPAKPRNPYACAA
jgi:hypothetical protein